jgi:hypothetical protein
MIFDGPNGKTLVSEEFNQMCMDECVEVQVQAMPNPGDPFRAIRMLTIRNFNDTTVRVMQYNDKNTVHYIPAKGSVQMTLAAIEPMPSIERMTDAN